MAKQPSSSSSSSRRTALGGGAGPSSARMGSGSGPGLEPPRGKPVRYGSADGLLARHGLIASSSSNSSTASTSASVHAKGASGSIAAHTPAPTHTQRRRGTVGCINGIACSSSISPSAPGPSASTSSLTPSSSASQLPIPASSQTLAPPPPSRPFTHIFHATRSRINRSFGRSSGTAAAAASSILPAPAAAEENNRCTTRSRSGSASSSSSPASALSLSRPVSARTTNSAGAAAASSSSAASGSNSRRPATADAVVTGRGEKHTEALPAPLLGRTEQEQDAEGSGSASKGSRPHTAEARLPTLSVDTERIRGKEGEGEGSGLLTSRRNRSQTATEGIEAETAAAAAAAAAADLRSGLESYSIISATRAAASGTSSTAAFASALRYQPPVTPTSLLQVNPFEGVSNTSVHASASAKSAVSLSPSQQFFPTTAAPESATPSPPASATPSPPAPAPLTAPTRLKSLRPHTTESSNAPFAHTDAHRHRHSYSHHAHSHSRPSTSAGIRNSSKMRSSQTKTRRQLVGMLEQWDFTPQGLSESDLVNACCLVFEAALNLPATADASASSSKTIGQALGISLSEVRSFLASLNKLYDPSNAYHNFVHATDVLQAIYFFLVEVGAVPTLRRALLQTENRSLWERRATVVPGIVNSTHQFDVANSPLQPADTLALLFAAVGHDAGHPGLSNAFLVNAEATIAKAFDDKSPLENYHALMLEQNLCRTGFEGAVWETTVGSGGDKRRTNFGQLVRDCILATDMSLHFGYVAAIDALQERVAAKDAAALRAMSREDITLLCCAMLKSSDICNPSREIGIGRQWSINLRREWALQMDLEMGCNLPITVGCSTATPRKASVGADCAVLHQSCKIHDSMVRRTSAAQAIASIGGGGGSGASASEQQGMCLEDQEHLSEEYALAKGQVHFVELFVLPLFSSVANLLPTFARIRDVTKRNHSRWEERLARLEERMKQFDNPPDPQHAADLSRVLEQERARVAHIFLPRGKAQAGMTTSDALSAVKACIVEAVQKAHEGPLRVMEDVDGSSGSDSEAPKMADHLPFFTEPFSHARSGISKPLPQSFTRSVSDLSISSDNEIAQRSGGSEHGGFRSASVASLATQHSGASHASSPGTIFSTTSGASTTATSVMPSHPDHAPSAAHESKDSFFSLKGLSMTKLAASPQEIASAATTPKTSARRSSRERAADAKSPAEDSPDSLRRRFSSISLLGRRPLLKRSSTYTSMSKDQKSGRSSPSLAPMQFGIRRVSFPWLYGSSKTDDSGKGSNSPLRHSPAHRASLAIH